MSYAENTHTRAANPSSQWTNKHSAILAGLALVQFVAAYLIGTRGLLTNDQQLMFPPIAVTMVIPVTVFLLAYATSSRLRGLLLSLDIRTLTMVQLWRVIGFGFLTLYAFGVLPGLFAWPAGLGDVAIGLGALFVVARMDRDPDYQTSKGLVRFHLLGLLDFVIAFATVGLSAGAFPGLISNGLTSAAMDVWPLNIFPSFLVPAFIILQVIVLLKVRYLRKASRETLIAATQTA